MTLAQYDEMSPPLIELIKKQPGFLLHVAYEDASGLVAAEVWETQEARHLVRREREAQHPG